MLSLSPEEANSTLALYQQLRLQTKQYLCGAVPVVISLSMFHVLHRLGYHPHLSDEQQLLLQLLHKVQRVVINGKGKMSVDLDLSLFPSVLSLRLEEMSIRSLLKGTNVAELALVDCALEQPISSACFLALRNIEFERTPINPRHLVQFAYSLRHFTVRQGDSVFEKPFWRLPSADESDAQLTAWHGVTHVTIKANRVLFKELDSSWERLSNLTSMTLSGLGLVDLAPITVLKRCGNLLMMDLSRNKLSSVSLLPIVGPHLLHLNLSYNDIVNVDGIQELKCLRVLYLDGNHIRAWGEMKEIADGCKALESIGLRGNPILSQIEDRSEVVPLVASIFEFRAMRIDGETSDGSRRKADALFMTRHINLFQRHRGDEDMVSEQSRQTMPVGSSRRSCSKYRRAVSLSSEPSHRNDDSHSPAPSGRRRIVRGQIVPDQKPGAVALPTSQLDSITETDPGFVDVKGLAEKHKDRWLTAVSAQQAALQRTSRKETMMNVAALEQTKDTSNEVSNMDTAPQRSPRKKKGGLNIPVEKAKGPKDSTKVKSKKGSRDLEGLSNPSAAVDNQRDESLRREGWKILRDSIKQKKTELFAHHSDTGEATYSRVVPPASTIPRQDPVQGPTPLFQQFLNSLQSREWTHMANDKRVKVFPSGCGLLLSRICAENGHLWGIHDDDLTTPTVSHGAVEVLLHDAHGNHHQTMSSRHFGKSLVRVIEHHTGFTRAVRIEHSKCESLEGVSWSGRPAITAMFHTPLQTQPVDPHVEVIRGSVAGKVQRASPQPSDLDLAESGVDTSKISREILRVMRPQILAGFVVEDGPATVLLLDFLKEQLLSCHSRLCATKIMREWPLSLDDAPVKRDSERSVPIAMSSAHVLDRIRYYAEEDSNRQRIGCQTMINGEELRVNLSQEIFPMLSKDRFRATVYANLVGEHAEETAVLVIVTDGAVLIASDRNYHGGCMTTDSAFSEIQKLSATSIRQVRVSFNLQTIQIEGFILQTRDAGLSLGLLAALQSSSSKLEIVVVPCPYKDITAAPLIFSIGVFMRRPIGAPRKVNDRNLAFPLRHVKEDMLSVTIVLTSTDIIILTESSPMMEGSVVQRKEKRPLASLAAFAVANDELNPLLFGLHVNNLEKGIRELWLFAAQHPNTICFLYMELRHHLGARMNLVDLNKRAYASGQLL